MADYTFEDFTNAAVELYEMLGVSPPSDIEMMNAYRSLYISNVETPAWATAIAPQHSVWLTKIPW